MKAGSPQKVLDIGCGTGFQSYLYAYGGSSVVGIDISEHRIKLAMNKRKSLLSNNKLVLFPESFDFVTRYNRIINQNSSTLYPSFNLVIEKIESITIEQVESFSS